MSLTLKPETLEYELLPDYYTGLPTPNDEDVNEIFEQVSAELLETLNIY